MIKKTPLKFPAEVISRKRKTNLPWIKRNPKIHPEKQRRSGQSKLREKHLYFDFFFLNSSFSTFSERCQQFPLVVQCKKTKYANQDISEAFPIMTPSALQYRFAETFFQRRLSCFFGILHFFRQIKLNCFFSLKSGKTKFWKSWPDLLTVNLTCRTRCFLHFLFSNEGFSMMSLIGSYSQCPLIISEISEFHWSKLKGNTKFQTSFSYQMKRTRNFK